MSLYAVSAMHIQSVLNTDFESNQNVLYVIGQEALFTSLEILQDIKDSLKNNTRHFNINPKTFYSSDGLPSGNIINFYNTNSNATVMHGKIASINQNLGGTILNSSFNFGGLS